jgi:hypothetical protein
MGRRPEWTATVDEAGKRRILAAYDSGISVALIAKRFDRSQAWVKRQIAIATATSSSQGLACDFGQTA